MPCRDYYDDHPQAYYNDVTKPALQKQIAFAESVLCQALVALEYVDSLVQTIKPKQGEYYDWINFREAGTTKEEVVVWHKKHKELDEKHREEERLKKVKEDALAKLSAEEKKVLGL